MLSTEETPKENKLDFLQRQSWQLELIITGFALAGMISGADKFHNLILSAGDVARQIDYIGPAARFILWGIDLAYFVTILHFFMNVVLRCLWIGSLALRGVMNKNNYLNDDYTPNFDRYLNRRHGDFDRYVDRLDKAASLVFAFTFFLIAILFGIVFYLLVYMGFFALMMVLFDAIGAGIAGVVFLFYALVGLLYLTDFLTSGAFKRGGEAFYFPIYRVMGWLTLARLYRPLYYAVISNKWGKRLLLAMVPYLLLLVFLPQQTLNPIPYIDRVDFISNGDMKAVRKDRFYADAAGFRPTAVPVYIDSDVITDKVNADSLLIANFFGVMDLRLDGKNVDLNDVLLSVSYAGSTLPKLVAYFPLNETEPGMHRLEFRVFGLSTKGENKGNINLKNTFWVPFFYAPE